MPTKKINNESNTETIVVSFRLPRSIVKMIDGIASGDTRTRSNFVARTLTNAVTLEPAIQTIEYIQKYLCADIERDAESKQTEYGRGQMHGAGLMLSAFFGDSARRWVKRKVCEKSGLPMPSIVPLQPDGERYCFDSEADF